MTSYGIEYVVILSNVRTNSNLDLISITFILQLENVIDMCNDNWGLNKSISVPLAAHPFQNWTECAHVLVTLLLTNVFCIYLPCCPKSFE